MAHIIVDGATDRLSKKYFILIHTNDKKIFSCKIHFNTSLTLEPDLPGGSVGRHAGLAGPLVGAVLQPDH